MKNPTDLSFEYLTAAGAAASAAARAEAIFADVSPASLDKPVKGLLVRAGDTLRASGSVVIGTGFTTVQMSNAQHDISAADFGTIASNSTDVPSRGKKWASGGLRNGMVHDISHDTQLFFTETPTGYSVLPSGSHICKWSLGDPSDAHPTFCGAHTVDETPYCSEHTPAAYNASHPKSAMKRMAATGQFVESKPASGSKPARGRARD